VFDAISTKHLPAKLKSSEPASQKSVVADGQCESKKPISLGLVAQDLTPEKRSGTGALHSLKLDYQV
jgi:hypothetical protein